MQAVRHFYRAILNAMPLPTFLVDDHMQVTRLNQAANDLPWLDPAAVLRKHGREIFHCLHETGGCGLGLACSDCIIRKSTAECIAHRTVHRQNIKFEATIDGTRRELRVSVTMVPMPFEGDNVVLMIFEDISAVTLLNDLIPICMYCRKIRNDEQSWERVETYFNRYVGVNFSHGICPDCQPLHERESA